MSVAKLTENHTAMDPELPSDFYNHKLDRMDPELAKALREGVNSTVPSFGIGSERDEEENYNGVSNSRSARTYASASELTTHPQSEVDRVVDKYWGLEHTRTLVASRHRELAYLRYNEEQANASNERYRHEIRRLKHENRKLGDCLALRRDRRHRHIMRAVYEHIRAVDYESAAKLAEAKARWRENEELRREHGVMREAQEALLREFGKDTPEEVFENFPDVWEPLEVRKNRRNFS